MVDPGADCTIGGMVACGASGTAAVKYGTMRENVLGLEIVLPDGTHATCGSRALKSSAGYDLVSIMTGSEGTLGVICSVTVKLHPIPSHILAASCAFKDLHSAAEAVVALRYTGVPLARCEILDEASLKAFNQSRSQREDESGGTTPMDVKPTLFLEFSGHDETVTMHDMEAAKSICASHHGTNFQHAAEDEKRRAVWNARHALYYAAIGLRPGATSRSTLVTDACVPLSKFAGIISATARDVTELNVVGPCFGHAGDGNFHCILPMLPTDSPDYIKRVHTVNGNLIQRAIDAGGTCTGEHGVGYGKMKYLPKQYGEGGVAMMRAIKHSLDPLNIMNPGKIC